MSINGIKNQKSMDQDMNLKKKRCIKEETIVSLTTWFNFKDDAFEFSVLALLVDVLSDFWMLVFDSVLDVLYVVSSDEEAQKSDLVTELCRISVNRSILESESFL